MDRKLLVYWGVPVLLAACSNNDKAYDASGVFEATEVTVSAKTQGEVLNLWADEGDAIQEGDTLGAIDNRQLVFQKEQLVNNRQANDSRVMDVETQIASVKQQITNTQKEKVRFEELLQEKAASRKQVDDLDYQLSVLQKQLAQLTEQLSTQNRSLKDQSKGIDAQISQVEEQLTDAVITSPLTGTVIQKYVEKGEYVSPGKALFKLANLQTMKLRAYLTADQVAGIKLGQKVRVYADQGVADRKEYEGTITWISQKAEFTPKTIMTRDERANLVYAIKIRINNDGLIKAGMYGDIKL